MPTYLQMVVMYHLINNNLLSVQSWHCSRGGIPCATKVPPFAALLSQLSGSCLIDLVTLCVCCGDEFVGVLSVQRYPSNHIKLVVVNLLIGLFEPKRAHSAHCCAPPSVSAMPNACFVLRERRRLFLGKDSFCESAILARWNLATSSCTCSEPPTRRPTGSL